MQATTAADAAAVDDGPAVDGAVVIADAQTDGAGEDSCFPALPCTDYGDCPGAMECNLALGRCQPLHCSPDGTPCSTSLSCTSRHCGDGICTACDCTAVCKAEVECFTGFDDVAVCVAACEANGRTVDPCVCPHLGQPWCVDILKCMGG